MIAQSAEHLHGLGGDVFMLLEIFGQLAINFDLTDLTRTCRIFGSDELGAAQPFKQLLFRSIDDTTEFDTFRTDFLLRTDGGRLGLDAERADPINVDAVPLR